MIGPDRDELLAAIPRETDRLAWQDAMSDPKFRTALDDGLADVAAGRLVPYDPDPLTPEVHQAAAEYSIELARQRFSRSGDRRHVSRRRRLTPAHVIAAGLLGLALGFLAARAAFATGHAHPSAIRFAPVRIPAAPSMESTSDPAVSLSWQSSHRSDGLGGVGGSNPPRGVQGASTPGLILDPNLATLPPRPAVEQPRPDVAVRSVGTASGAITGIASYYDWRPGEAAACAPLRAALGAGWRGRVVSVNGITVRLTDYCPQGGRVIDLASSVFQQIAPLSRGLVTVEIRW